MKQILLLFVAVVLVGCGKSITVIESSELPPLRVDSKNYVINKTLQVNTGDTLIRRQKYVVRRWEANDVVSADKDTEVTFAGPLNSETTTQFTQDWKVRAIGTLEHEGKELLIVPLNSPPNRNVKYGLAIDQDTRLTFKKGIWRDGFGQWHVSSREPVINPLDTKFKKYLQTEVIQTKTAPYLNYEIVYTGYSGDEITLLYREFDKKDFARTAFFQNLKYEVSDGAADIRFRDILMKVNKVGNQNINITVIEDDESKK